MAPGLVSAFGRKLKCVADFVGKYCGFESQLLESFPTGVGSYFDPGVSGASHIVCGVEFGGKDCLDAFELLMFGLDNEVRTEPDGGGGVGDLQEGVTKTFSDSGTGADGGRSGFLKMFLF